MPYVEKNYRVLADRAAPRHRRASRWAAARRSTSRFRTWTSSPTSASSAPASSARSGPARPEHARRLPRRPPLAWEEQHLAALDNAGLKKGLKLLWFSTGKDDFLIQTTQGHRGAAEEARLQRRSSTRVAGGHTWLNWRNYLNEFAPQLFR